MKWWILLFTISKWYSSLGLASVTWKIWLILTVKLGNQGIIVLEYFINNRLSPLIQLSGKITSSIYIDLLENNFLPFYNNLENCIF